MHSTLCFCPQPSDVRPDPLPELSMHHFKSVVNASAGGQALVPRSYIPFGISPF